MIVKFRHKGLKQAYENSDFRRVPHDLTNRIYIALSYLDSARKNQI